MRQSLELWHDHASVPADDEVAGDYNEDRVGLLSDGSLPPSKTRKGDEAAHGHLRSCVAQALGTAL